MEGVPPSKDFLQSILKVGERLVRTDARLNQAFDDEGNSWWVW
jgi:hypothetical protein